MRWQRGTRFGALLMLMGVAVAGCDSLTDPLDDFDPQQASQTVDDMMTAVETEELDDAYGSLDQAEFLFSSGTALLLDHPVQYDLTTFIGVDALPEAAVIPSEYWGTTFVWDESQMEYVASDRSGAPSDGVRVIYYAIDPTTGMPASPLNELGYVDATDQSTDQSNKLGLEVVRTSGSSDVTLADYTLEVSFTFTQTALTFSFATVGYVSDGTNQLNFDLSQDGQVTETTAEVNASYSMDLEGTDKALTFDATVTGDPQSDSEDPETMDAEATITNGDETVRIEVLWENDTLEGTIYHNGTAVVLMSGTLDEPTFTDTDGNELTQSQKDALDSLWDDIGSMFDFAEELFGPAD